MDLAVVCLAALVAVVVLSCALSVNIGLLAMTLAWLIGTVVAPFFGESIPAKTIVGFFPVDLFITLVGSTLLFSVAQQNGTLRWITDAALAVCRGSSRFVPWLFFLLSAGMSAAGAGNVATVALLASSAMLAARRLGVAPLLMTIMVGHGGIGGTLSPLSPMGIIAHAKITDMGLGDFRGHTFLVNLAVNTIVAFGGYMLLRGWRHRAAAVEGGDAARPGPAADDHGAGATPARIATLLLIAALIAGVVGFGAHLGLAAFGAATLLILGNAVDERAAIREVPWNVVLMICGMSMLVTLCEKSGGLKLFGHLLGASATPATVTAWMAGITGLISVFSSTTGVVLPAFLPMVPDVLASLPGGGAVTQEQLLAVATSVNVGSNLVDVSSVSTIGALCVAATPGEADRRRLFRDALVWGLSMSVVGAVLCGLLL